MKEFITLKEVQETIMVSNPGGRSITIETQKSGYNEVQTLTSAIFPDKIFGEYIGLAKLKDNSIHPAYMLNTSRQKLILKGFIGFSNGPEILNEIWSKLLFQNELMVYGKKGKPCPICHQPIVKIKVNGRGTHYCPNCQKED